MGCSCNVPKRPESVPEPVDTERLKTGCNIEPGTPVNTLDMRTAWIVIFLAVTILVTVVYGVSH